MSVANNPFAIKKLMMGLGAMQEPQLSPEQQLYVKEKKSIEKLVRNYEIYPDRWGKDKLRKLKSLADRYEIPFEVERATSGQYAKSAIVGAVDSILFDMIPDDKYITPGTEGTASAGKWAGIVIPVLAATAATIATKGAAGPAAASTISRLMGNIAKSSPAAAKVLQTSGKVLKGAYCGWYGEDIDIPFWSRETYFVLEHVLPVFSFPQLRLDDKNIVIACNHCNKDKGGKVLHSSLSDIIIKFQKDRLDGIIKNNKSFDERYGRVCEFK